MTPEDFVSKLERLRFEHTFNPYSEQCDVFDRPGAPRKRSIMLLNILKTAYTTDIDSIWIGRDLGHRGGRRTGLAMTDDVHIGTHAARWGLDADRPTKGELVAERTAATIWRILTHIDTPVFLWNVFPLHPHEPSDPFSNRSHNSTERRAGEDILCQLIVLLKPKRLIAVGNDAGNSARRLAGKQEVVQVRHPSYGGQREFLRQTTDLYNLPRDLESNLSPAQRKLAMEQTDIQ